MTRRGVLVASAGAVAVAAGVIVGADKLITDLGGLGGIFGDSGHNIEGSFYSRYRRRVVGYTVGYPQGHGPGSTLPVVIAMHGFRGNHRSAVSGYSPSGAASLANDIHPLAVVTVDGGQGYWHPHPGDDPMSMVTRELIPLLNARGLGIGTRQTAVMGTSMGGYGALIFAEHYPATFAAAAAISPAIFETFSWAHYVNPGAYYDASDFASYDAITHASQLSGQPVRVASGDEDPFHPWVEDFKRALPAPGAVDFSPGGHNGAFFASQTGPSIRFIASHFA